MTERVCHIRNVLNLTLCGVDKGESISMKHFREHVFENREGCCRLLFYRLCLQCYEKAFSQL